MAAAKTKERTRSDAGASKRGAAGSAAAGRPSAGAKGPSADPAAEEAKAAYFQSLRASETLRAASGDLKKDGKLTGTALEQELLRAFTSARTGTPVLRRKFDSGYVRALTEEEAAWAAENGVTAEIVAEDYEGEMLVENGEDDPEYYVTDDFDLEKLVAEADMLHELVRHVMTIFRDALLAGRPVALFNIGTLQPYLKDGHRYKHPTTGEFEMTDPRVHVKFVLSPNMRTSLKAVPKKVQKKLG